MTTSAAEGWAEMPLRQFAVEARLRSALLLRESGQVVAQHGFLRAMDVMAACALGAAIHASAALLGRELDGAPFTELHHAGGERELVLAEARTADGPLLVLAVYGDESSYGVVRLCLASLRRALAAAAPAERAPAAIGLDFEQELASNLARLFPAGDARDRAAQTSA